MTARIKFFPVGNGDMTLIELETGRRILIDVCISQAAVSSSDPAPNVAKQLHDAVKKDEYGRPYVDVLLLSHPDEDHCRGLREHFYLGPMALYPKDSGKIWVRELWSSPMVFRRASKKHTLCEDAKAFTAEARRRVKQFQTDKQLFVDGNRILILGEDEGGKTDDLGEILVKVDQVFDRVCGVVDWSFSARLLGPLPKSDDEEEAVLSKNDSSTILNMSISGGSTGLCQFLSGGDAEVAIWERLWERNEAQSDRLQYDVLQTPHHCSWHSLSHESWSDTRGKAKVSPKARKALSQARRGAVIVASSKAIKNDYDDPPCWGAKAEYESIVTGVSGTFVCVGEPASAPSMVEIEVSASGPRLVRRNPTATGGTAVGRQPVGHG